MVAGIIYFEYKVAKMNNADNEGELAVIMKVLDGLGAKDIEWDGKGWIRFRLDDEVLFVNVSYSPLIEVLLQNSTDGCPDMDVAHEIAEKLTARFAGGRVTIKEGNIFISWASFLSGHDAFQEGLPLILSYLFQVREEFVSSYWKALATKQKNNKPVS